MIAKRLFWLIPVIFILCGCAVVRHAVPEEFLTSASVYGMQDIRAFGGISSDAFKRDFLGLLEQDQKDSLPFFRTSRTYHILTISGGGSNAAYAAGLLSGWSKAGTRPVFKVVTGISSGAVIAPFAFLGSAYDDKMKEICTTYRTRDIVRLRMPFINSFATIQPFERIIERYFDAGTLEHIAAEYRKGRRLYVGTTNLDAERLVIWDMGKIASAGNEEALRLFRKIILASSSVPVAFPPVYLDVKANDIMYDEMHVDGGISKQVFFLYDVLQGFGNACKEKGIELSRNKYAIYVIRNGYIGPFYREVPDRLTPIAERTVDAIINSQGIGDLFQLYLFAKQNKVDFNLAYIPLRHIPKPKEPFDPVEMRRLFDLGFSEAVEGYEWKKTPPGMKKK